MCPSPGPQDVEVFMVPNTGEAEFFAYVKSSAQRKGLGINSPPPTAIREATSHIDIAHNAKPRC